LENLSGRLVRPLFGVLEKYIMSRRLTRILLLPLLLVAGQVLALGLGDIRLSSALNEPLRAEIDLLAATPEELNNLTVQLASAETFKRYGLERPLFLADMQFNVLKTGTASGNLIEVRTASPVTEPFVTFLVEAVWSRGRLLREYTLLLDPPTFAPPPATQSTQSVTAPSRSNQSDAGRIERPAPAPAPAPRASQPPQRVEAPVQSRPVESPPSDAPGEALPAPAEAAPRESIPPEPFDTSSGGDLLVHRGDTLWSIARRVRPDNRISMSQMLMALYDANPDAFSNNINILSAGAMLRIPSADEIFRIGRGDALSAVQQQHADWSGGTVSATRQPIPTQTEPNLTLVAPDEDQTGYDDSASSTGSTEYSREVEIEDRISELEASVPDQVSLIEIRNNELAQLRAELARLRGEEPPELMDPAIDDDTAALDDETLIDDAEATDDDEIFVGDDADSGETLADDEATTEPVVDTQEPAGITLQAPKPSLLDTILGYVLSVWGALAGAIIVVLGILVWFARRAASDDDDSTGLWEALDADAADSESLASTERLRALARDEDTSIVVVEQESKAAMAAEMAADKEPQDEIEASQVSVDLSDESGSKKSLEDTFSSETAINLDQSDPIAEADFHMAYGLHDQAADLINGALEVEPERQDLLAKLCEVYFVWGNRDAFVDAAQKMKNVVGDASSAEWDKIIIMGQQIAADNELFSGKSAGEATKAVDLSFDGAMDETSALDIDLASGPDGEVSDIIDLGADSDGVAAMGDASNIDFAFEEEVDTAASATAEMPSDTLEDALDSPEWDDDTVGTDATAETPTIEQQFETFDATAEVEALSEDEATQLASLDDEPTDSDATAEIDLDDLGLDLDSLSKTSLSSDLDATGTNQEAQSDDVLAETGLNHMLDEMDASDQTGMHAAMDETGASDSTGIHAGLDISDALLATSETDISSADATGRNPLLGDYSVSPDADPEGETSLLDATGQTQVLPDDFAVDTTSDAEADITDDEQTMLASTINEERPLGELPGDAETLLAPLDDEDDEYAKTEGLVEDDVGDFDFAKTEALPKDVFTSEPSTDETGELPNLAGSTDMDLDLDDLTAALKISEVGDTINQRRDDATVEQPRLQPETPDVDDDESATQALSPDEVSGDLHDARTMTEVGTKLDLARAYVDMGDPAGAKSILEEVLDEGDESQRQQAQQLLDSLPT
jgi:pilus assembly protein FimV